MLSSFDVRFAQLQCSKEILNCAFASYDSVRIMKVLSDSIRMMIVLSDSVDMIIVLSDFFVRFLSHDIESVLRNISFCVLCICAQHFSPSSSSVLLCAVLPSSLALCSIFVRSGFVP